MKLIKDDQTVLEYDEKNDKLTVFAEFAKVEWKKRHFVHLSTFFARAENDWLNLGSPDQELPDIVIQNPDKKGA